VHLLVRRACEWPPGGGMPNAAFDEDLTTGGAGTP
jgi:hypothetical protein